MTNILVTYASKHGATAEIAQKVARILKAFKLDVTARRVSYIEDISAYDVLILGSALYLGDWIPEAVDFLEEHHEALKDKEVWLFTSGPTGDGEALDLIEGDFIPEDVALFAEEINPRDIKLFKGKIDLRRLPPDEREIVKAAEVPRGDYRDWEAIRTWAEEIATALSVTSIMNQPEQAIVIVDD